MAKWRDNFETVAMACPTSFVTGKESTLPIDEIRGSERLTFVPLPAAYSPLKFLRQLPLTVKLLRGLVDKCAYLHFAIGGFSGDWGALSALIAHGKGRPFAVWTDRVESEVLRFHALSKHGLRRLNAHLTAFLTKRLERAVIRRARLGLFHGMDCFQAYARFSPSPHLVDDIHIGAEFHITETDLRARLDRCGPLQFAYAGRAHEDKGVFDWIDVFFELSKRGLAFEATWYGNGPELERARSAVLSRNLENIIKLPGRVPHSEVLSHLKGSDVFVFCHKTQESPRCLIESLAAGLPLVGYSSEYAKHLVANNKGGLFFPEGNIGDLVSGLEELFERPKLIDLCLRAARDDWPAPVPKTPN